MKDVEALEEVVASLDEIILLDKSLPMTKLPSGHILNLARAYLGRAAECARTIRSKLNVTVVQNTNEFRPCPFCGGTDIRCTNHGKISHRNDDVWSMCCYNCGATFPNRYTRELLVENWNRRVGG